jgi:hypothetical protein
MEEKLKYLTDVQVAKITGIAVQTLRNDRCASRRIPYVKFGRAIRYNIEDVISFMEGHKIRPNQGRR